MPINSNKSESKKEIATVQDLIDLLSTIKDKNKQLEFFDEYQSGYLGDWVLLEETSNCVELKFRSNLA